MKCPKCNTEIFGKQETCPLCGHALDGSSVGEAPESVRRNLESSENRVKEILSARASRSTDVSGDLIYGDHRGEEPREFTHTVDAITDVNSDIEFNTATPSDFGFDEPVGVLSSKEAAGGGEDSSALSKTKTLLRVNRAARSRRVEPASENEELEKLNRKIGLGETEHGRGSARAKRQKQQKQHKPVERREKAERKKQRNPIGSVIKGHLPQIIKVVCGVAALVVLMFVISAIVRGCSASVANVSKDDYPVIYLKGNALISQYGGTSTTLSENTVNENTYPAPAEGEEPVTYDKLSLVTDEGLVKISENGKYIYYIDHYDVVNKYGSLNAVEVKSGKKTVIAEEVSNSFVLTPDGEKVMYLAGADSTGNMGSLYSRDLSEKESLKINDDMDSGTFVFSQNEDNVLFIQNFDNASYSGDLYIKNIRKKNSEKRKIDSEVYSVFGSDRTGKVFVYAKEYNVSSGVYDVYIKSEDSEKKRVVEQAKTPPVITKTLDMMYVYGVLENGSQSLYATNTLSGEKEKIASGVSDIVQMSSDEKIIIFNKVYENNMADYYLYNLSGEQLKIASNVHTLKNTDFYGLRQFDISADFSKVTYISSFDTQRGGGALYSVGFEDGKTSDSVKVADNAYACSISDNGKLIYYANNYNAEHNNVNIYRYKNGENTLVLGEIDAKKFSFTNDGMNILYQTGVDESGAGSLAISSDDAKSVTLGDGVYAFFQTSSGDIFMIKNVTDSSYGVYITNEKGSENATLDTDISGIVKY